VSTQGVEEQKYLVRLVGVCLEQQERLFVYEFVPNRNLDKILFGTNTNHISVRISIFASVFGAFRTNERDTDKSVQLDLGKN
jgi:hypothetical protein